MNNRLLTHSFFQRDTREVARELLGKILVSNINNQLVSGIITETEAYCGIDDPASHAACGKTKRNASLFGQTGRTYVYLSYGIHLCLNVVAYNHEKAGGVLIRAIEITDGIDIVRQRRNSKNLKSLTNGPGKVGQALAINLDLNSVDVTQIGPIYLCDIGHSFQYIATPRIGITKNKGALLRFVKIN